LGNSEYQNLSQVGKAVIVCALFEIIQPDITVVALEGYPCSAAL